MRILFIGEIVGSAGIYCVKALLPGLKRELGIDLTIASAEGATGGFGIGKGHAVYLHKLGVDVITAGDFAYFKRDAVSYFGQARYLLRPANYPYGNPGRGWLVARPRPAQSRPGAAAQRLERQPAAAAAQSATATRQPADVPQPPAGSATPATATGEPAAASAEAHATARTSAGAAPGRPAAAAARRPGDVTAGARASGASPATVAEGTQAAAADGTRVDAAGDGAAGAAGHLATGAVGGAATDGQATPGTEDRPAAAGNRPAAAGNRPAAAGNTPAAAGNTPAAAGNTPAAAGNVATLPASAAPRARQSSAKRGGNRGGRRKPASVPPPAAAGDSPPLGVGVISLLGQAGFSRVHLRNPFEMAGGLIERVKQQTRIVLVDFHATTTSEKVAMSLYLDGKVTALIGTHVRTLSADARILPGGTAAITHSGRTGSLNSVGGLDPEVETRMFLTQVHEQSRDAWGLLELQGAVLEVGPDGKAVSIEPLRRQTTAPEAARKAAEAQRHRGPGRGRRPGGRR